MNSKLTDENITDTMREIDELERQFKAKIESTKKTRDGNISDGMSRLFLDLSYSLYPYPTYIHNVLLPFLFIFLHISLFCPFLPLT